MSEKEVGKATSHLQTSIEEHKSDDSVIIDIPESLEREVWSKCCIQRVPRRLRKVNEKAYTPQHVSIGPFHHDKPELLGMEPHKRRYLDEFCKRFGENQAELVRHFIRDRYDEILQSYAGTVKVKGEAFIEMVLVDACFIIELFLRKRGKREEHEDDYILHTPWLCSDIVLDLIMLENQLPYAFLKKLYDFVFIPHSPISEATENKQIADEVTLLSSQHLNSNIDIYPFSKLACEFFDCTEDVEIKHFTDLFRRALCPPESDNTGSDTGEESENCLSYLCSAKKLHSAGEHGLSYLCSAKKLHSAGEHGLSYLYSAKKLHSAGVQLFKSKNVRFADLEIKASKLFGVPCLKSTRLGLPEFCVEDRTECLLRNIMALEQCLYPEETYICDYICLLDQLINDTEDVDLLVEKKIVRNLLGSNAEVAKLVNKLGEEIYYDDEKCYKEVCKKLDDHCKNWLNRTRATIKRVYFKDCWTGSTAIVGFFVLLFSISATIKALFFS